MALGLDGRLRCLLHVGDWGGMARVLRSLGVDDHRDH